MKSPCPKRLWATNCCAIAALAPEVSRGEARRLIAAGMVFVDGKRIGIQSRPVRAGERLSWASSPIAPADRTAGGVEPRIVVETSDLWIVDKPAGMPVEPTRLGKHGTLHEWLTERFGAAFVTHRLDTATRGLIAVARTRDARGAAERAVRGARCHAALSGDRLAAAAR